MLHQLIKKRYNGQTGSYDLVQSEKISEEDAKAIGNYLYLNPRQTESFYEYVLTGPGVKIIYRTISNDLLGLAKLPLPPITQ